ncbi:MAG: EMC3/TMCO1 family protein [archaeon]
MFVSPAVDLVLVSAGFAVISQTIQLLLLDRKETRRIQKQMQEKNKQYREMISKGEKTNKQDLDKVQAELMELSMGSMKRMPKVMIANMIVFLPLFAMVSNAYHGMKLETFFPINLIWNELDWFWYYVLCSLIISLVVSSALNWYDTRNDKKNDTQHGKHTVNTNAQ